MKKTILSIIFLIALHTLALAHGGEKHGKQDQKIAQPDSANHEEEATHEHQETGTTSTTNSDKDVTASFSDFPNLHPLVVHFPIVLLLLAAVAQVVQFFVFRYELSWVTLVLLIAGFAGAYIAGTYVHPHPEGLSEFTQKVLEEHEQYASLTIWLSGVAVVLKIVSHFWLKRIIWSEILVCMVLISAAYTVSMAGHHGSQLVFIEGVGPQGKHLEEHTH